MKICLTLAVMLCAAGLSAQTINITGTVPDNRVHFYLIEVDQGAAPTAVDVTFSITTGSSAGLLVALTDLDDHATQTGTYIVFDDVVGAGTASNTLSLSARTGVHQLIMTIETDDAGSSAYTGTVTVSAGTIAQGGLDNSPYLTSGVQTHFGRFILLVRAGNGSHRVDIDVDFGGMSHATTFSAEVDSENVDEFSILDLSTDPATVLENSSPGGDYFDDLVVTTPSRSGPVTLRIQFTRSGSGYSIALVVLGSDVQFVGASSPAPKSSKPSTSDGDCTVGSGGTKGVVALASVAALYALRRRRKAGLD